MRGGQVVVLGEIPGGDDGICCASAAQRERWLWKNGALVEDPAARQALPADGS